MTHKEFFRLINIVQRYGHKVLVEDNYSDQQLKELVSALSDLFEEVSWK